MMIKNWGKTSIINSETDSWIAIIRKYKNCSMHYHTNADNEFILISGKISIRIYDSSLKQINEIILNKPLDKHIVSKNTIHDFYSHKNSVIIENYYGCKNHDIIRITSPSANVNQATLLG